MLAICLAPESFLKKIRVVLEGQGLRCWSQSLFLQKNKGVFVGAGLIYKGTNQIHDWNTFQLRTLPAYLP